MILIDYILFTVLGSCVRNYTVSQKLTKYLNALIFLNTKRKYMNKLKINCTGFVTLSPRVKNAINGHTVYEIFGAF